MSRGRLVVVGLLACCAASAFAAQSVNLTCTGAVTSEKDGAQSSVDSSRLDLVIDLDKSQMKGEGNWGCTLLAVKLFSCGSFPVDVSVLQDKIVFREEAESDIYSASASFTINRLSGSMRTQSSLLNKRPDAVWRLVSFTGEFQCEVAKQQF